MSISDLLADFMSSLTLPVPIIALVRNFGEILNYCDLSPSVVWFRQDLRLDDNPALEAAVVLGRPIVPVFIWSPEGDDDEWRPGAASRWWLHHSLTSLRKDLQRLGSELVIRKGAGLAALRSVIKESNAQSVFWNRRYEPANIARDKKIKGALGEQGINVETFNSHLLIEPWQVHTKTGKPFQVFTPFWNACLALLREGVQCRKSPPRILSPRFWPASVPLEKLELEPRIDWAQGIKKTWQPGMKGAEVQLDRFLDECLSAYREQRNQPAVAGTSRLSPHLHFGEMSPRRVWQKMHAKLADRGGRTLAVGAEAYLGELGWREFGHHLLYHFPHTVDQPLRPEFASFPWEKNKRLLRAWQRGQTGYPFVDAGMRELWATGWMHNRVRMVVASFLVKDLLIPWQEGARWFWDTLVDADLANNTLGWQWIAGSGADASPYFRIFNPASQGEKFDPEGDYIRRWVPELQRVPTPWLHQPWMAPHQVLADAGVQLGRDYPLPVVDHGPARQKALQLYRDLKSHMVGMK